MRENISFSLQAILSHKMRSLLTMLGVIIGIASIIAIVSTIKGTNEQIMENLIGAGNNNVNITLKQGDYDYYMDYGTPSGVVPIDEDQMKEIRELSGVEDASFYLSRSYADVQHPCGHDPDEPGFRLEPDGCPDIYPDQHSQ